MDNDSLIIRSMRQEDIDAVYKIETLCFSSPWSKNSFSDEIKSNVCARYLVAVLNNKVVAYGGMWLIINEAHITNIAVHPLFRRRKIASEVLKAMMHLAHDELDIKRMTLEVRKGNHSAQALYRKYGFKVAGERKNYYEDNEDASIMWCDDITLYL